MQITHTWTVTSTPDQTYEDTINVAYQDAKCEAAGAITYDCAVEAKGDGHVITVNRVMSSGSVPDLVKKVVGDKVDVVEVVTWGAPKDDGSRDGAIDVSFKGQPISMKGTAKIAADGAGSRVSVDLDLKAKIPLVGGKIEKMSGPEILAALKSEESVSREWGSRH